ncbi:hypothetical protein [Gordonia sp. (in: high G+C Gram-positive bacteria)]|uniref:hypothetical protein n=1 Tax=Gordonia sp. (in: high G+C Gram-positive bacteria) TaxID=84139 RepID=UPI0039E25053
MTEVDDLFLSRADRRALSDRLRQIPIWLTTELDTAICREVAMSESAAVRAPGETPLVFNDRASQAAHHLLDTLGYWVEEICTLANLDWPGSGRADHYAKWLDWHLIDLAKLPEGQRAHRDIDQAINRAIAAVDKAKQPEFAGPCQSDLQGVACDGVYVRPGQLHKTCDGCGIRCDVQQMQQQMRDEISTRLYPAHELASALSIVTRQPVAYERVRNWIRRGRLIPATTVGEPRFYMSDAIDLINRQGGAA